jgi:hypothetical protein
MFPFKCPIKIFYHVSPCYFLILTFSNEYLYKSIHIAFKVSQALMVGVFNNRQEKSQFLMFNMFLLEFNIQLQKIRVVVFDFLHLFHKSFLNFSLHIRIMNIFILFNEPQWVWHQCNFIYFPIACLLVSIKYVVLNRLIE